MFRSLHILHIFCHIPNNNGTNFPGILNCLGGNVPVPIPPGAVLRDSQVMTAIHDKSIATKIKGLC